MTFYRALLRLFPRAFRERYGRDMTEVFSDRWRMARRRGTTSTAWLALRTIADVAVHAAAEHRTNRRVLDHIVRDVRFALRSFARRPGFTAVAMTTIALGIGANTAIFSVVRPLLLESPPFPEADRVVNVSEVPRDRPGDTGNVSNPANFDAWERRTDVFAALGAFTGARATLTGAGEPVRLRWCTATPSFFAVFGLAPALGRTFNDEEAAANARVVVISDRLWRSRFAADPGVVGRDLTLDGRRWQIIGVMPPEFDVPYEVSGWLPLALTPALRANHDTWFLSVVGRLAPGVSIEGANAGLDAAMRQVAADVPGFNVNRSARAIGWHDSAVSGVRRNLWMLQAVTLLVLLVACANLANLLMAQAAGRAREFAIRVAIGAGRRHVVRQLVTESIVLSGAGGLAGAGIAAWAVPALVRIAPAWSRLPRAKELSVGWTDLAAALTLAVVAGVLFSALPALIAGRHAASSAGWARGSTASRRQQRTRSWLVASQVALALVLLSGAGLLARSFGRLTAQPIGFDADHVLTAELSLPPLVYDTEDKRRHLFSTLIDGVAARPGVTAATASTALPFTWWESSDSFRVLDRGTAAPIRVPYRIVAPTYLDTLHIPLLRGKDFSSTDTASSPRVALVNEQFAVKHGGSGGVVGMTLSRGSAADAPRITIVGVVGNTRHRSFERPAQAELYLPLAQWGPSTMTLAVRSQGNPFDLTAHMRGVLSELDPNLPLAEVKLLEAWVSDAVAEQRFYMVLLTGFAGLAAVLAVVGVYGVTAYVVRLRTREIGIRLALGASARGVTRLMIRQGIVPVAGGAAIGIACALGTTRVLQNQLFQIDARDPATLAGTAVAFTLVATAACWIPSRRTSRVDPAEVLVSEG
jgi:putative ABC transport system permease protein